MSSEKEEGTHPSFMGVAFQRVGQSARMWFHSADIAHKFGIGRAALLNKMRASDAAPFRALSINAKDLRAYLAQNKALNPPAPEPMFDLDYLLAVAFSLPTQTAREVRDWICVTVNRLVFDGFVSLEIAEPDLKLRRALVAYVTGEQNYYEVVKNRFDPTDSARGTNYAPVDLTDDLVASPDSYLTREEITRVKAMELAMQLFSLHGNNIPMEQILEVCGINVESMAGSDEDAENCRSWTLLNHHSYRR